MSNHIVGSSGFKQCQRNEIQALIRTFEMPAFFITINPSDICNLLIGLLGDIQVHEWQVMTSFKHGAFVACHPVLAAMFFHKIMAHFLDIVVHADSESPGLFEWCEAYYGMVEAQGRGTLHCHLLLWLSGNPNPQLLYDQIQSSLEYR